MMEKLIDAETMASLGGNWTAALGFLAARLVVLGLGGGRQGRGEAAI